MKKILGMPLAVLVIGLMVIGGASAVLVNYLSNEATTEISVTSPMSIKMAEVTHNMDNVEIEDRVWEIGQIDEELYTESLTEISTTGLSSVYLGVRLENYADVDISDEILRVKVSNDINTPDVTCADLTSLTFIDVGMSVPNEQDLVGIGLCTATNGIATYDIPINLLNAGETYKYPVKVTFGNVAPATYSFDAELVIE